MSLRKKLLSAIIGVTVVVLTLVIGVILRELFVARRDFLKFDRDLRRGTIQSLQSIRNPIDEDSPVIRHSFVRDVIYVPGADADGEFLVMKGQGDVEQATVRRLVRRAIARGAPVVEGDRVAMPRRSEADGRMIGGWYFFLSIPSFSPHEPLQKVYIVMLLGVVIIMVVSYFVLSRAVIRPIERLERAAKRVAGGDYSRPVPLAGRGDEIDTLIHTFNAMMVEVGAYRKYLEEREQEAREKARKAEQNLIIAQRLAATGKFASGIAHEVNNPLAGMMNAARRLKRDPPADPKKREEYLDLIIDGLARIGETVKQVLQFTPHRVAPQPVALETILSKALRLVSHRIEKEGIEVVVDVPPEARVYGDMFELEQVVLNLLINAMDAIEEAGRKGEIGIRAAVEGQEVRLSVSDNGVGMSGEEVSQAFDLFFTTKEVGEGTGLGLSIAHNVIENHGGRMELKSVPGEGTTVEITLPLLAEAG